MEVIIIYTLESERRIKDIFDYYSKKAGSKIALGIINNLLDDTELLKTNPHIGIFEELLSNRKNKYYSLIISNYKIIYSINGNVIFVATIFDTRQNPKKIKNRLK